MAELAVQVSYCIDTYEVSHIVGCRSESFYYLFTRNEQNRLNILWRRLYGTLSSRNKSSKDRLCFHHVCFECSILSALLLEYELVCITFSACVWQNYLSVLVQFSTTLFYYVPTYIGLVLSGIQWATNFSRISCHCMASILCLVFHLKSHIHNSWHMTYTRHIHTQTQRSTRPVTVILASSCCRIFRFLYAA